ncbi:OprD family porin [Pseudomonas monteilii]|uniref:OprD family outer membrane porin n=1 Tax=Pseudomonas monteilii TaxID=76759 RepID=UPI001E4F696F|nr:OprD family outer membrane porin [Pseudomonas monteilii]MCE1020686.1 OprD family porin [Pseudomonas monteilii]MCE1038215.1 OprD family porin [Pseudomonas monteilii]MCE1089780.1 OprD family porin [Pseudomonas monteilii]
MSKLSCASLASFAVVFTSPSFAASSTTIEGFLAGSALNVLLRNAYISRDYRTGSQDKAEWGQAFISRFSSGFYELSGVDVGFDAFGLAALKLDGGGGTSGANGIDFFKRDSDGNPARDISRAGGAVKVRVSNTIFQYGDLMPTLPVLNTDDSRLLPENFIGTMVTSKEIDHVEMVAGHFNAETRKSAAGRDSGGLDKIDVVGGYFDFSPQLQASLFHSDVQGRLRRSFASASYTIPLSDHRSLNFDFNGYVTKHDKAFAQSLSTGQDNKLWSLALNYKFGPHTVVLAYQQSAGDSPYVYGGYQSAGYVGDGGGTIFVANSYWSDFNAEDERSLQIGYGVDFAEYGLPGLSYRIAAVKGVDIRTADGEGEERELFNQLQYVVQSGAAKDLKVRLRASWVRVSNNARAYNQGGDEIRAFIEYPINVF